VHQFAQNSCASMVEVSADHQHPLKKAERSVTVVLRLSPRSGKEELWAAKMRSYIY